MDDASYQQYLNSRASKAIPPAAFDLITQHVGSIRSKQPIIAGEDSLVFRIEAEQKSYLAKIQLSPYPELRAEHTILTQLNQDRWPVPTPLALIHQPYEAGIMTILLETWCEGQQLNDNEYLPGLAAEVVPLLKHVHSLPAPGFGYLNDVPLVKTYRDRLDHYIGIAQKLQESAVDEQQTHYQQAIARFETAQKRDWPAATLVHGDFAPKNMLVQNGHLSAVLDWSDVQGHWPCFDLFRWEYWFGRTPQWQSLWDEYYPTLTEIETTRLHEMRQLIMLELAIGTINWYTRVGFAEGVKENCERLVRIILPQS